ncbi:MAG: DNA-protecting protein DprA [Alphaproteobacteria bacterium]|nr:MAG: DNA-protecting protein DprA [Alphaproteobacteria bacterium]
MHDNPDSVPLSTAEKLARLRLIRSENVGPVTFRQLIARYGSAVDALDALPELARRGGLRRPIRICPRAEAEREIGLAEGLGMTPLYWGDRAYPRPLAHIEDAPAVLFALGHIHLLDKPMVAVIGARNASAAGRKLAGTIARDLGLAGYVVVSGLARGIDAAAHAATVATGTVAVLAGGADVIYPKENVEIYESIVKEGVVLSEMPPGTEPQARHFPRRNRIISGLSLGVLVVEANPRSGSLITARYALDQGREVFAVPGSPLDPRARGANRLLKDGAALIEDAGDIIEILRSQQERRIEEPDRLAVQVAPLEPPPGEDLDRARHQIRELLSLTPTAIDDLIRQTGLAPATVLTVMLELELAGLAERHPGGRVALV